MKVILHKASDWDFEEEIEVKTIEDLKKLDEEYGEHGLILRFDQLTFDQLTLEEFEYPTITIYDDYVE